MLEELAISLVSEWKKRLHTLYEAVPVKITQGFGVAANFINVMGGLERSVQFDSGEFGDKMGHCGYSLRNHMSRTACKSEAKIKMHNLGVDYYKIG